MTSRVARWVRTGLRLAVTAVLLIVIFRWVALGEVFQVVGSARGGWLGAALPLVLLAPVLSAVRLEILLRAQGSDVGLGDIIHVNLTTAFWGLALPGTLAGGAVRWLKLRQAGGGSVEPAAAIVYSRLAYMGCMAFLGAAFVLLDVPRRATWVAWTGLLLFAGFLGALALVGARVDHRHIVRRLPGGEDGFLGRLAAAAARYRTMPGRERVRVVLVALAENLVSTLCVYFLALAVRLDLSFVTLGWVRAVVVTLVSLPISISGLGVREGSLVLALGPYGVAGVQALALSVLLLGRTLLVGSVGGALEVADLVRARRAARSAQP